VRFLIDTNLPPAMADWLRAKGHETEHAAAVLSPTAKDPQIWALALANGATVVTKDLDYVDLAKRAQQGSVVLVRCGNMKLKDFQPWFAARFPTILAALDDGERIVEAR
jgi:predicted nuclease of predicted toxin-antitoxin system